MAGVGRNIPWVDPGITPGNDTNRPLGPYPDKEDMMQLFLVGAGGAAGSVLRYMLSGWVLHHAANLRFPLATFAVNMLGCLVVGVLGGLAVKYDLLSSNTRLFLFTGVIGGFTTYSAFGLETFHLMRRGEILIAGSYVASSVVIGLLVLWFGFSVIAFRR